MALRLRDARNIFVTPRRRSPGSTTPIGSDSIARIVATARGRAPHCTGPHCLALVLQNADETEGAIAVPHSPGIAMRNTHSFIPAFTLALPLVACILLTPACSSAPAAQPSPVDEEVETQPPTDAGYSPQFAIRGLVKGLAGTGLVLHEASGSDVTVAKNGSFVFGTRIARGANYEVTVQAQPGAPAQTCTVTNGAGTVGHFDVTNVLVECVTHRFSIGGTVTGLRGTGLVLQNDFADDNPISAAGAFTFTGKLIPGEAYWVTVYLPPSNQTCTVTKGSGTITDANITDVVVTCTP